MRSKKRPSESFAIAIPITAKVCPIISLYTAWTAESIGKADMGCPNPCTPAIVIKIVYRSRNTWNVVSV
jgi:hypothetical protein